MNVTTASFCRLLCRQIAMGMKLVLLVVCFGPWISASSAAPAGTTLEEGALFNLTLIPRLHERALVKRDVWNECMNDEFRPLLNRAMIDALPIVSIGKAPAERTAQAI